MGRFFEEITEKQTKFIAKQHIFYVGTSPLSQDGTINVSPKGYDAFRVVDKNTVLYFDLMGSGIETVAHLKENGRVTFMFCAVEGPPLIVRLYGKGQAFERGTKEYEKYKTMFPESLYANKGGRSIVLAKIHRTQDSCGYAVPFMDYKGDRSKLLEHNDEMADEKRNEKLTTGYNAFSIDGLPGRDDKASVTYRSGNKPKTKVPNASHERSFLPFATGVIAGVALAVAVRHLRN